MLFLFSRGILAKLLALIVFIIASLTDFYDGYFARKHNLITDFGKLMDPIADKLLVLGAFLAFVELRLVPAWMVVLIITRELFITGLRLLAITKDKVISAVSGGKHKTASQMLTIIFILIFVIFKEVAIHNSLWNSKMQFLLNLGILTLMSVTVILTLTSGISYLWKNRNLIVNYKP
jgi:CDP-diacylglycerol--glycerol-3-phosphate 3-phosphatidyltransferase